MPRSSTDSRRCWWSFIARRTSRIYGIAFSPPTTSMIEQYQAPVGRAVLLANAYTRNPTSGYLGHHFQIYFDLLGAPNQVQTRSYVDDNFVVITPSKELRTFDIRHAYLHYLIDPMRTEVLQAVDRKSAAWRLRARLAPSGRALQDRLRSCWPRSASSKRLKAAWTRNPTRRSRRAKEGYVLTPAFAELLAGVYEKQEQSMRLYFPRSDRRTRSGARGKEVGSYRVREEATGRNVHVTGEEASGAYGRRINAG